MGLSLCLEKKQVFIRDPLSNEMKSIGLDQRKLSLLSWRAAILVSPHHTRRGEITDQSVHCWEGWGEGCSAELPKHSSTDLYRNPSCSHLLFCGDPQVLPYTRL